MTLPHTHCTSVVRSTGLANASCACRIGAKKTNALLICRNNPSGNLNFQSGFPRLKRRVFLDWNSGFSGRLTIKHTSPTAFLRLDQFRSDDAASNRGHRALMIISPRKTIPCAPARRGPHQSRGKGEPEPLTCCSRAVIGSV